MSIEPLPDGFRHVPGYLDRTAQEALVEALRVIAAEAPFFVPAMPRTGKAMTVRMTNCGPLGWVSDRERGYRYQEMHPATGAPWPAMPETIMSIWREEAGWPQPPQACLVNYYDGSAKMGMHQDRDETELSAPVLSLSLGDACLFRLGGTERGGKTRSFRLESGDLVVLGGASRMRFHGVDRIYPGTSDLLPKGGRINLTLRRVTA